MSAVSRRKFVQVITAAGASGTLLLEKMYVEAQSAGGLSRESVRSFANLSGLTVRDDQMDSLRTSLERALDSMKRIRDRTVAQNREPAVTFRVRR
jgi:hypothetical protein